MPKSKTRKAKPTNKKRTSLFTGGVKELDLQMPLLRLARAKDQIAELDIRIKSYVGNVKCKFICEGDQTLTRKGIKQAVRIVQIPEIDPINSIHVGEIVHNLRSCLNQIAATAVISGGGKITKKTDFPIHKNAAVFGDNIAAQLKGVPPGFVDLIERFAPHGDARDKRLWWLSELNNQDKHEAILMAAETIKVADFGHAEILRIIERHNKSLRSGDKSPTEAYIEAPVHVCFSKTRVLSGEEIVESVFSISERVSEVVKAAVSFRY